MKYNNVKLGDYLYIKGRIGWKGLKKEEYLPKSDYRIINGESLTEDGIDWSKAGYISRERYEESPEIMLENEDILISKDGTIGKIGFVESLDGCATVASGIFVIRNQRPQEINTRYVYHFLCSKAFKDFITMRTEGSVIPHLYQKDFVELVVPLPELTVQEKIVSILDTITLKIENNKAINNNLQQQAQAVFSDIFINHPLDSWRLGVLSDIAEIIMGQSPSGDSYNEDGNGTVFFQGRAEFGSRFPTIRLYTTEAKRLAKKNDILMSVRAPVGDINIAHEDCCIGRGLAALRSKTGHQSFLLYLLFALQPQLNVFNGEGTVFGSINRDSLNKLVITIPDKSSIKRFESAVAPMDAMIRANHDENCRLAAVRDLLLPRLMSGEIDVSEVEI